MSVEPSCVNCVYACSSCEASGRCKLKHRFCKLGIDTKRVEDARNNICSKWTGTVRYRTSIESTAAPFVSF